MRPISLFLTIIFISAGCSNNNYISLNSAQTPQYVISLKNAESTEDLKAAQVLQEYFKKISGKDFSIEKEGTSHPTIIVGTDEKLEEHTIHYSFENSNLKIHGGSDQSTIYAIYDFLESALNCRFYAPEVEVIPEQEVISIDKNLNYSYTPPIETRTVHSRLFYKNPAFAEKQKVTKEAFPTYVPIARVHTFHRFMPADQFLKQHPEYYALRNGKRLSTQLCLTNESVFQIVRDSVKAQLQRYPDAKVISVSQDDNTQYCQCANCEAIHQKEESPAGSMIHFVNRIAKEFPEKQISTLAYQYTRKAPKHVKPEPNVLITLCSIECDRSSSIEEKCQDFKNDLVEWGALTDNIRIWDYTTQFTNFLAPFPNIHTLHPNIELFKNNNAKWIFEQHSNNPSELFELRSYLTAKLLWNPELKAEVIIEDFLEGYYEEAAPFIQSYITKIHDEIRKDSSFFLFLYGDPSQGFRSFLNEENLTHYDSLYAAASETVREKPDVLNRVNMARLSVDYAWLEYTKTNLFEFLKNDNGKEIEERLERFAGTTSQNNITAMNEMRFTVKEYLDGYQKTLKRAQQENFAYQKPVQLLTKPKKYADEDPQTLTDGAFGGNNFYANWLGFEGEYLHAVIDLGETKTIHEISTAFLQVTNHIVFFPKNVSFSISENGKDFTKMKTVKNQFPLSKNSKINDIQYFRYKGPAQPARYIEIKAESDITAPEWHHGAGLPSWIFLDEVMVR